MKVYLVFTSLHGLENCELCGVYSTRELAEQCAIDFIPKERTPWSRGPLEIVEREIDKTDGVLLCALDDYKESKSC